MQDSTNRRNGGGGTLLSAQFFVTLMSIKSVLFKKDKPNSLNGQKIYADTS